MIGSAILYHILLIAAVTHFARKGYQLIDPHCDNFVVVSEEQPYERDEELDQLHYETYMLMEEAQELVDITRAMEN